KQSRPQLPRHSMAEPPADQPVDQTRQVYTRSARYPTMPIDPGKSRNARVAWDAEGTRMMSNSRRFAAEFIGTFWLVLGGCGSAVLAAAFPNVGIGLLGVSLAFGLTVLTMAYGIGHISGCHLNPAVSLGLWAGKRFPADQLAPYIIAQVLGASAVGGVRYSRASGH